MCTSGPSTVLFVPFEPAAAIARHRTQLQHVPWLAMPVTIVRKVIRRSATGKVCNTGVVYHGMSVLPGRPLVLAGWCGQWSCGRAGGYLLFDRRPALHIFIVSVRHSAPVPLPPLSRFRFDRPLSPVAFFNLPAPPCLLQPPKLASFIGMGGKKH